MIKRNLKMVFIIFLVFILFLLLFNIFQNIGNVNVISTYIWHTEKIFSHSEEYLSFCELKGIEEIYVQVDPNISVGEYRAFINLAHSRGVKTYALGGDPRWVADKKDEFETFFKWIVEYQNVVESNEKFAGVHLDIEPYLLSKSLYSEFNEILKNYQVVLLESLEICKTNDLKLMAVIPFWFNEVEYDTIHGQGNMAEWVISHVDTTVIMAYRNKAEGENGITKLISEEIEYSETYNSNIIIAIETSKSNEGEFISFYDLSEEYMLGELKKLKTVIKNNKYIEGFSIHYLDTWMEMERQTK